MHIWRRPFCSRNRKMMGCIPSISPQQNSVTRGLFGGCCDWDLWCQWRLAWNILVYLWELFRLIQNLSVCSILLLGTNLCSVLLLENILVYLWELLGLIQIRVYVAFCYLAKVHVAFCYLGIPWMPKNWTFGGSKKPWQNIPKSIIWEPFRPREAYPPMRSNFEIF